jgi:hypothetical protein
LTRPLYTQEEDTYDLEVGRYLILKSMIR